MRLAVVTSTISRNAGGLFQSVRSLHKTLAKVGLKSRIMALRDEFTEEDICAWQPLEVAVHKTRGLRSLGFSSSFIKDLFSYAPDIVHVHGLWQGPSIASLLYRARTGRPNVISPRGMLDPWAYRNSKWKKQIAGLLFEFRHLKTATCINALCNSELRSIRKFGLRNPIAVVPNGVDLPEFDPTFRNGKEMLGRKTLLFIGRMHPKKGLVNALRAWALV